MGSLDVDLKARDANLSCPYCHGTLLSGGLVWSCPSCATLHHRECAVENGRCTVLGCKAPVEAGKGLEFAAAPPSNDRVVLAVALFLVGAAIVFGSAFVFFSLLLPAHAAAPVARPAPRAAPVPASSGFFPRSTLEGPGGSLSLPLERPSIVNVWLEGCPDCAPSFARWKQLAKSNRRLPVVNVAYNGSSPGYAEANGVSENLVFDRGGAAVVNPLGIGTFTTYVVAADGRILFTGHPGQDDFPGQLEAAVDAALGDGR